MAVIVNDSTDIYAYAFFFSDKNNYTDRQK